MSVSGGFELDFNELIFHTQILVEKKLEPNMIEMILTNNMPK